MSVFEKINNLTNQLYPRGRAFRAPKNGFMRKLKEGLAESEKRFWDDAVSTLDSAIADNANFTADDATAWERRLGLITGNGVLLSDRKLAINRKYNHPGSIKARQHYLFLQKQLRDAGFDVYVHENRFSYGDGSYYSLTPIEIDPSYPIVSGQHSNALQHGDTQHGGSYGNKVVNYIDEGLDNAFDIGEDLTMTFFIGGAYLGDWTTVDYNRKDEFRQLILRTKPAHSVAFLFITFY